MAPEVKKCPECAEEVKADAIKCRFCGFRFDDSDKTHVPSDKRASLKRGYGCVGAAIFGLIVLIFMANLSKPGSRLASTPFGVDGQMHSITQKVAEDAVKQYNIASSGGKAVDRCVQAGFVAAAYLQAQDQQQYDSWKSIEAGDCKVAGVPR